MGNFNLQAQTLVGSEWRPQTSRNIVLTSLTQAVAMRFRPGNVTLADIDTYIASLSGTPGIAIEVVSTLVPTLDSPTVVYPGTDTGATLSSWVNESAGTASYTKVAKNLPTTTYLTNSVSTQANLLFRGATSISAGKRVVSVTQNVLISYPGGITGGTSNSNIQIGQPFAYYFAGASAAFAPVSSPLSLGGTTYSSGVSTTSPLATYTTFSTPAMMNNPSTNLPWKLGDVNTLTNGSDSFGVQKAVSSYTGEHRIAGMWLTVNTVPENRVGAAYSLNNTTYWSQNAMSYWDTSGSISAFSSNTYYYLVIYLLSVAGGASIAIPALKDTSLIMATGPSASTGSYRLAYDCTLSNGIVTASTANTGEMIPALIEAGAGTFNADCQPYATLTGTAVASGPAQQLTLTAGNTYTGIRFNLGCQSAAQFPDGPLVITARRGLGAKTGAGTSTVMATATIPPTVLTTSAFTDYATTWDQSATLTVPNSRAVSDGVSNGTTTITSASAAFTNADVGASITGTDIAAGTTIATVTNSTTAVLSAAATGSHTGDSWTIGATQQYAIYFSTTATAGQSWQVGLLDTGSNNVTTITAANVETQGIGAKTDSYVTTAGTATTRYDIPVLLVPSVTALASPAATVEAAV